MAPRRNPRHERHTRTARPTETKTPIRVYVDKPQAEEHKEPAEGEGAEVRRMRITNSALQKYGYQDTCRAYQLKKAGLNESVNHEESCRRRTMEAMIPDEDGQRALRADKDRLDRRNARTHRRPDWTTHRWMLAPSDKMNTDPLTQATISLWGDRRQDEQAHRNKRKHEILEQLRGCSRDIQSTQGDGIRKKAQLNGRTTWMDNGLGDRIRFRKTTRSSKSLEICERVEADASDRGPECTVFNSLQT